MDFDNRDFYLYTLIGFHGPSKARKYYYILTEILIQIPDTRKNGRMQTIEVKKFNKKEKLPYCNMSTEEYATKYMNLELTDVFKAHHVFITNFVHCDSFRLYELSYDVIYYKDDNGNLIYKNKTITNKDYAHKLLLELLIKMDNISNPVNVKSIKVKRSE